MCKSTFINPFATAALLCGLMSPGMAADVTVVTGSSTPFTATVYDQFGEAMLTQPSIDWTTTIGSLSLNAGSTVNLLASSETGTGSLIASSGNLSAVRSVEIILPPDAPPVAIIDAVQAMTDSDEDGVESITLTQSSTDDDGIVSYEWSIDGMSVGTEASLAYQFPVGDTTVQLSVTDSAGQTDDVTSIVSVFEPAAGLDFRQFAWLSYGGFQDEEGNPAVSDDGSTVTFSGNTWKGIALPVTITDDTVLSVEVQVSAIGEIQGIGFDTALNNYRTAQSRVFQLAGTQRWAIDDYINDGGAEWVRIEIPVGSFYTGEFDYLTFLNDDDRSSSPGVVSFRNVQISDGVTPPTPDTTAPSVPVHLIATNVTTSRVDLSWTASTDDIGVTEYEVFQGGVSLGTTSTTTLQVTGLNFSTAYAFTVTAIDAAGNSSAASEALSVTTSAPAPATLDVVAGVFSGQVSGTPPFSLTVDGVSVPVNDDGTFTTTLNMPGADLSSIELQLTDANGQSAIRTVEVNELDTPVNNN